MRAVGWRIGVLFVFSLLALVGCSRGGDEYPADFNFVFTYGVMNKNVLDTFSDTYTKDLVMDGLTTTGLTLDNSVKREIYARMKEIGLFDYAERVEGQNMLPESGYTFDIAYGGKRKKITWIGEFADSDRDREFRALTRRIIDAIQSTEAYRALPEGRGGYL